MHNPLHALPSPDARRRFRLESMGLVAAALAFIVASHYGQWFIALDRVIYDGVITRSPAPMREDVVVVAIDDESLASWGPWPWPRELQARLIGEIGKHDPEVVALDIIYVNNTTADASLVAASAKVPHLALPMMIDQFSFKEPYIEVLPFPDLLEQAEMVGHVQIEVDDDAIVRGTHLYQGLGTPVWPHLTLAIAEYLGFEHTPECEVAPVSMFYIAECDYVRLPFAGPPGTYPTVSANLLLSPEGAGATPQLLDQTLRQKVVFVGMTALGGGDWISSPLGYDTSPLSGVEFNANLFSALTLKQLIRPAAPLFILALSCVLVLLSCFALPRQQPKWALSTSIVLALLPVVITVIGLLAFRLHIPLANAILAAVLIYPLWSWRRHEIAWSFVQRELGRVVAEGQRWQFATPAADDVQARQSNVSLLGQLLQTEISVDPITQAPQPSRQLNPVEQEILQATWNQLTHAQPDQRLPTERLAAQIERLQRRANVLRSGRDTALAGLDRMSSGTLIVSLLGEAHFVNVAARRWLHWQNQQPTLSQLNQIQTPLGQSWTDIWRATVIERKSIAFESQLPLEDAESNNPIFVTAGPLVDEDNAVSAWVITLADLSEIRTAQAQREEALAFLSHDLRSPLASILALLQQHDGDSQLLQDIRRYTQRGLSTSEQFLQLSRLQLQQTFETYPLDVEQLLHNAAEQTYFLAKEKSIEITVDVADTAQLEEGIWIDGNGELLERALVNLLGNAIKYSEPNTAIKMRMADVQQWVEIQVEDQGYGIPADEIEQIFDPYFRSASPRLAGQRGAGLGLRFVKTVIDRHQGRLQVASQVDHGTTFTLHLPLEADAPEL